MGTVPARTQFIFSGQVQGVGFRATALAIARRYALTGWVANQHGGTVKLELQGDQSEINACLAELKEAMNHNITSHTAADCPLVPDERGFTIRH